MFVLEGAFLWVINEVSNTIKHLEIIDEKNQYTMRTAEETTSLALVFVHVKMPVILAVFSGVKLTWIGIVVTGNNAES